MLKLFVQTSLVAALGTVVLGSSLAAQTESADAHIVDVVAITQIFADGLKVSAVAIQYDRNISDASLNAADFTVQTDVAGQKITRVYTSKNGLQTTRSGLNGPYVVLELSTDYVIPVPVRKVATPPPAARPPAPQAARPELVKEPIVLNPEVVAQVGNISWDPAAHPATLKSSRHGGNGKSVSVNQVGEIAATDGLTLTATTAARDNFYVRNLIVDGFLKPDFASATQGNVKYNIHFPANYDPAKSYPMVVYLSDSDSPAGYTHAEYLIRGLGAVVWADKADESQRPAVVLVPTYSRPLINEAYEPTVATRPGGSGQTSTPYLAIVELVDAMMEKIPNIDRNRVYLTGQGDGARAALRMMEDRPDLYAAALLFSPDYDATRAARLAKARMWIVTSEGDSAAHASMESFTAALKASGARVGQSVWDGQASPAKFASTVRDQTKVGAHINYSLLKQGTVVPQGMPDDAQHNHVYTWRIGYAIEPLREWLLDQEK